MANKETAMKLGTVLMGALPEVERCAVVASVPLGFEGYIVTLIAYDETQVNVVYNESEPDKLWELDEIPDAKPGFAASAVMREFPTVGGMSYRWPNAVRSALTNDWSTLEIMREIPGWNGNPFEFVANDVAGITITRLGRMDNNESAWSCLALDMEHAPDRIVRQNADTAAQAINAAVHQIIRNRSTNAAIQRKLENMDDSTLNA